MWLGVMLAVSTGYFSCRLLGGTILTNLKEYAWFFSASHAEFPRASSATSDQCIESGPEDG